MWRCAARRCGASVGAGRRRPLRAAGASRLSRPGWLAGSPLLAPAPSSSSGCSPAAACRGGGGVCGGGQAELPQAAAHLGEGADEQQEPQERDRHPHEEGAWWLALGWGVGVQVGYSRGWRAQLTGRSATAAGEVLSLALARRALKAALYGWRGSAPGQQAAAPGAAAARRAATAWRRAPEPTWAHRFLAPAPRCMAGWQRRRRPRMRSVRFANTHPPHAPPGTPAGVCGSGWLQGCPARGGG